MRRILVVALAAVLAVAAWADDGKAPAVKVIPLEAWESSVAGVAAAESQIPARVARLRALAQGTLVEVRGKIRDIVKDAEGVDPTTVVACGIYGGPDLRSFIVATDEVEEVRAWQKWDRLTWRVRPRVADSGDVTYEIASGRLLDWVRIPNPGFEPRPQTKATAAHDAYMTWIAEFAKAAYAKDETKSAAAWARGCAKTWIISATVSTRDDTHRAVRLNEDGYIDAKKNVRVGTAPNGAAIMQEKIVGWWGWGPNEDIDVTTDDPQAVALLTCGTRVDIAVDLDPAECTTAMAGKFRATIRPWRIKGKK